MRILVTGAKGFIGKNLCRRLKSIQFGKDPGYRELNIEELYECDRRSTDEQLEFFCKNVDFVFHFAGVNRPDNAEAYMEGNKGFTEKLLKMLKKSGNRCPIVYASSIQASLEGRYANSEYGISKLAGENLLFQYGRDHDVKVFIYRFPNVFGKWCRPDYNSAVATFCYNMAHDLPIQIHDANTQLELLYIDDLTEGMLAAVIGREERCMYQGLQLIPDRGGDFCYIPGTYQVTLGMIVEELRAFHEQSRTITMPEQAPGSFQKKLYATYLSYLPPEKMIYPLKTNYDSRGSFTELVKSRACGQISVNISSPGITKGQHWHNTKWELFIVVSGHGLIAERKLDSDEVLEFEVDGKHPQAVYMLPGYTHSITNLSDTEDLITIMWANESFDPEKPDTFSEEVW